MEIVFLDHSVAMADWKLILQTIYFNPNETGAFAGPQKVKQILKQKGYSVPMKEIKQWLQDQDAYSLLRQVKYRFRRQRIVTSGLDDMWDADLADVSNLHQHNPPYKYWLIVIDVFSRFLWLIPVPTKHHTHMVQAFKNLFKSTKRRPKKLRTDKGTEFTNRAVRKLLESEGIYAYTTKNETKANYAERVIRTMKGLLYRYFLHRQTYQYIDVIEKLVQNYNSRPHRSLKGLSPSEITKDNEAKVWKCMYVDTSKRNTKIKYQFKVNDKVRISHLKYTFQRDFHQKWTEELFIVTRRIRRSGHKFYCLKDYADEDIDGYFYETELQKVRKPSDMVLKVEKVLKQRTRQGQKEYLVKYVGWPQKFNAWVKSDNMQAI